MVETKTINIHGRLYDFDTPKIMGIINVTPDSFYADSRSFTTDVIKPRVARHLAEGADILDIGGYSTRPGAEDISPEEEYTRLARALEVIRKEWPDTIVSIDTFRGEVARRCIEDFNVEIINDVAGGALDPSIWEVVAEYKVPYILMHMRGTPDTMQSLTDYEDVTRDVVLDLARKTAALRSMGVADVILDPGFGFAKTVDQNWQLMAELEEFTREGLPLLVGISHKTMIWRPLGISPSEALNGTTVLNTIALQKGADILRVHEVKPAVEARALVEMMKRNTPANNISGK
jgi:dihydropteroate synthase